MNSGSAAIPAAPVNPSCFGTIEHTAMEAARVANRVQSIVNRLAGDVPLKGAASTTSDPDGLLAEATEHTLSIQSSLNDISAALDRLEKNLP